MKPSSLALRLILLAFVTVAIALGATTFVLDKLFYKNFEERVYSELDQYLKQLTANIVIDDRGTVSVQDLPDPRFALPYSGLYWQIRETGQEDVLSRSLWGRAFDMPAAPAAGSEIRASIISQSGIPLLALGWTILLGDAPAQRAVDLSVAIDQSEVIAAATRFRTAFLQWLALMFVALVLAFWVQVRLGLAPLEAIRQKVGQVRSGDRQRLQGAFPREVQPLVDEVNELLDLHEKSLARARARASDLAHGLKTPLTVMLALARDLRNEGQSTTAREIEEQVESMRQYIERELARVRTRTPTTKGAPVAPVVQKMVRALQKFPRDVPLDWDIQVPQDLISPFDEHDLSELLGNTLDNARKWAKSQILIEGIVHDNGYHTLRIQDDGPGVPPDRYAAILARGERLDPSVQGQGLGLAICVDLAQSYGVDFVLAQSPLGGLQVEIRWPAIYGEN